MELLGSSGLGGRNRSAHELHGVSVCFGEKGERLGGGGSRGGAAVAAAAAASAAAVIAAIGSAARQRRTHAESNK